MSPVALGTTKTTPAIELTTQNGDAVGPTERLSVPPFKRIKMSEVIIETFFMAEKRSAKIETEIQARPSAFRVLTGDRPTGSLHVGHLFGSLENRVRLQNLGVEVFVVIADYQVLTDRDSVAAVASNVRELVIDYLAAGLDPARTIIFPHSHVPALNQLLLPFLTLASVSELERNPTIQSEIKAAGIETVKAAMLAYPVHQAADILFCKGNLIPVGKDQLPHLVLSRKIARRFNAAYCSANDPFFPVPDALLSNAPDIRGLDGTQKMSKSRNNAIFLKASEDETAKLIKVATTDTDREITYDPCERTGVAGLLDLLSLVTNEKPEKLAATIGNGGGGKLKSMLTDALNAYLAPLRQRRKQIEADSGIVTETLKKGVQRANEEADNTLRRVRDLMGMSYGL